MSTIVPIKDTLYYLWNNFSWPSPKHITQNLSPIPVCLHHGPAVSPGNLFHLSEWLSQPSNCLSPKPRRQNPCRISSLLSILQKALIILALTVTQMHPPACPTLSPSTSLLIWSAIKASFMCSLLFHSCLLSNSFINHHWVTFFKHKLDMVIPLHKNPPWLPVVFRIKSMSNSLLWPLRTSQLSKLNSSHSSIHSPLPTPVSLPFLNMPSSSWLRAFTHFVASAWNSLFLHYSHGWLLLIFKSWFKWCFLRETFPDHPFKSMIPSYTLSQHSVFFAEFVPLIIILFVTLFSLFY